MIHFFNKSVSMISSYARGTIIPFSYFESRDETLMMLLLTFLEYKTNNRLVDDRSIRNLINSMLETKLAKDRMYVSGVLYGSIIL